MDAKQKLIIACSIIGAFAVFVLGVWAMSHILNRHYRKYLFSQDNSVRSFIIDRKNDVVRYFNKNNLREIRTLSLKEFYAQFDKKEVEELKKWFDVLLRKNSHTGEYFDINVYIDRSNKRYFSILKVISANSETRVIHLDSYLFLGIDSTKARQTFATKNMSIDDALKKCNIIPTNRGATIAFSFYATAKGSTQNNVDYLLYSRLKEIAMAYAVPPQRQLLEIAPNEFIVFDFRSIDQTAANAFVHRILDSMNSFLELFGKVNTTAIRIGVVQNSYFSHNLKKLVNTAHEMTSIANDKNLIIVSYDKDIVERVNSGDKYTSEIEKVIKDHHFNYTFSCVYDIKSEKVLGYLSHVELINSSAKTMEELYNRSIKTEETSKLLHEVMNESISRFSELNKDSSKILFKNLKFHDSDLFVQLMLKHPNYQLTPCFEEYDISYYTSHHKDFFDKIDRMKEIGIAPGLKLSDRTLVLDNKIYSSFDYFIIYLDDAKLTSKEISRLGFRTIVEKLLKYNKPIIVTRVHSWPAVELLVRSGIEYIAGEAIAPAAKTLHSPTSKCILKIRKMLE